MNKQNKQNKVISFKEWVNNGKEKLSNNDIVFIKCKHCNILIEKNGYKTYFKWQNKTPSEERMAFCSKCYLRIDKNGKILPIEVYDEFNKNGFILLDTFLKNIEFNSKLNIKCICENCNEHFLKRWDKIKSTIKHNHLGLKQYCPKCINKEITSSKGWREKNSAMQLIIQNKPEVRKKNSEGVKKALLNDPSIIERRRNTHKKTLENDPSIKEKMSLNSIKK